jgi:hypothetical protein
MSIRVTIDTGDLASKPAGWLRTWVTEREAAGCIQPGDGMKLGERIVEALPLESAQGARLLRIPFNARLASFVDLGPENRIQVNSPILREGGTTDAPIIESGKASQGSNPGAIVVEGHLASNVIGFETAWYGLKAKGKGLGFDIVPVYAERHIEGKMERAAEPHVNPFHFREDAGFYRIFYRGDRTIVVVAAATPTELERETVTFRDDLNACDKFPPGSCVLLPGSMGANAHIVVMANGNELPLPVGATVQAALAGAGEKKPADVVGHLTVRKLYGGKLAPLVFDTSSTEILSLVLVGGEELVWK